MKKDSVWWKNYYATHRESRAAYQRERYRRKKEEENRTFTNAQLADTVEKLRAKSDPSTLNSVDEFVKKVFPPVSELVKEIVEEVPVKMDNQAMKAILEAQVKAALIAKVPLFTTPEATFGKPCKLCGSKLTTEVLFSDPDCDGIMVWLCEKHRKEKGL